MVRQKDFSVDCYELYIGEEALELTGKNSGLSLPYSEIKDFCITQDKKGNLCFTMIYGDTLYEGEILGEESVESFAMALKEKLDGIINIEVRKS